MSSSKPSTPATVLARCRLLLFVFGLAARLLVAQGTEAPAPRPEGGLLIRNISAYTVYYSKTLPSSIDLRAPELRSDLGGGGSAEMGWSNVTERSRFSAIYTPSYDGRVRYASWSALNHSLSLNASRKLAPRWRFDSSINGELSTQEGFVFAPSAFSRAASVPASFDDFAAALLQQKFANPQLASALSSAPAQSPVSNLLFGARMFAAEAQVSFSYRYSPRLSLTFGGAGTRSQHVSDKQLDASSYFLSNTTSGTGGVTISYASPLTQLGGNVNTTRVSSLYHTQLTTSSISVGRIVARRWLLRVYGGVGVINVLRLPANSVLTTRPHPAFGGTLAFRTFSQTFLGSFDRTVSDPYGMGASRRSASSVSWRWKRPDRVWWLESAVNWEQLQGAGQEASGWRVSAGLGRSISAHIVLLTQYAYLKYSGRFQSIANALSQSAVRVSLVWNPHTDISR